MKIRSLSVLIFLFLLQSINVFGGMNIPSNEPEEEKHGAHHLSIVIAHTHVPKGFHSESGSVNLIVPSWGFNYDFWINNRWAIGLHNDMEIATYVIEDEHGSEIERERPIISTVVGIFKPSHLIGIIGGFGKEFEKHHSFWVFRLGLEFEFEIHNGWDFSPALIYDLKESVYDSWSLGVSVGKRF